MTRARALAWCARLVAIAAVVSTGALAQPQDYGSDVDPPVRVGRLSYLDGQVSFSPAGSDEWVVASLNRPIVTGDRLWSDVDSRIELATDNSAWWLGDQTSVTVSNLDDRIVQLQVHEGVLDAQVRRIPAGYIVEIDTPNLAFSVTRPGRYRIEVDPREGSTLVAVSDGEGEVYGEAASYVITSRQAYRFYGTDVTDSEFVSLPRPDSFDRFVSDRARRYTATARYVSPEVIGYEDLDQYGAWTVEASYGNVWFPRTVPSGWAPYRDGHWAWIDPWGWTWVDTLPWGFAPFHYGRWAYFNRGWGWVPGPKSVRAVYAPALVAFVGGAGIDIAIRSGPAIGWFPLAPHEVYVPPYHVTRNYFRQVNVSNTVVNVTNITNIYNNPSRVSQLTYANRRVTNAVTAVPPAAFAQAQNVARAAIPVAPAAVLRAQVHSVVPVAPARPALLGAAPAARVRPPTAAMQRAVVAKAPPPPPPVPDAQKIQALEKNPGRPLTQTQLQALRRAAPPAAVAPAPVRVVEQPKPAANASPRVNAARGGERRATPNVPPAGAGAATNAPTPAQRGGPPSATERAVPRPPEARGPQGQPEAAPRPPEARGRQGPPVVAPRPPQAAGPQGQPNAAARPPEARTPEIERAAPRPPEARGPQGMPEGRGPAAAPPGQANRPAPRPPESRPQPAPEPRATPRPPEARPQPAPEPRAAPRPPEARPQPAPEPRAAPRPPEASQQPLPEPRAGPRPPEARPQPAPEPRAAPRPPPQAHPQPAPEPPRAAPRPEPPRGPPAEPRGGPPPQAQGHPAPPAAQAPPPRPVPPGQEKGKGNDRNDQNG